MERSAIRGRHRVSPGFRGACHRAALRADPLAPSGVRCSPTSLLEATCPPWLDRNDPAYSWRSYMRNSILEGQTRYNQIGIALWLGAEHQYRLLRRSRAKRQNTLDIDRCEICGGNAKILRQQPCAGLDIDRGIEEEQRLVGVTASQHMRNLPPHAITCIDTQDNTIRIARELGDGLLPMSIVHVQALCTPGGLPCTALAISGIADGNQIATTVEALKHQFVEGGRHAAEIEYR